MIIKEIATVKATYKDTYNVANYIFNKSQGNEAINPQWGSIEDALDAFRDAEQYGRKHSILHLVFSSKEELKREQYVECIRMHSKEFGWKPSDAVAVVEHVKARDESAGRHFHVLLRMVDPENGRRMNRDNSYARIEKVEREFEHKFGLELLSGSHNKYVIQHTEDAALKARLEGMSRPARGFKKGEFGLARKNGHDMNADRKFIKDLWGRCDGWKSFTAALKSERGWDIVPGTKKPDVLVINDENGKYVGSACRMLGFRKNDLDRLVQASVDDVVAPPTPVESPKTDKPVKPAVVASKPVPYPEPVKADKPSVKAPAKPAKGGSAGTRVTLSSFIKQSMKGKTEQERNAEIFAENKQREDAEAIKKQVAEQNKFYAEYFEMLDKLIEQTITVKRAEIGEEPFKGNPKVFHKERLEKIYFNKINEALQNYISAKKSIFLWSSDKQRDLLVSRLKQYGFHQNGVTLDVLLSDPSPETLRQHCETFAASKIIARHAMVKKHNEKLMDHAEMKKDLFRLRDRIRECDDSKLRKLALNDPEAAVKMMHEMDAQATPETIPDRSPEPAPGAPEKDALGQPVRPSKKVKKLVVPTIG